MRRYLPARRSPRENSMFERFTEPSRRVVVLAQEEARMLNHNYIGTEHILLGLIHEREGVAARAIVSFGLTLEMARDQVRDIVGARPSGTVRAHPVHPAGEDGSRVVAARGAGAEEGLHRHRAHPARPDPGGPTGWAPRSWARPLRCRPCREKALLLTASEPSEPGPDEQLRDGVAGERVADGRSRPAAAARATAVVPARGDQRVPGDAGVDRRDAGSARPAADRRSSASSASPRSPRGAG